MLTTAHYASMFCFKHLVLVCLCLLSTRTVAKKMTRSSNTFHTSSTAVRTCVTCCDHLTHFLLVLLLLRRRPAGVVVVAAAAAAAASIKATFARITSVLCQAHPSSFAVAVLSKKKKKKRSRDSL